MYIYTCIYIYIYSLFKKTEKFENFKVQKGKKINVLKGIKISPYFEKYKNEKLPYPHYQPLLTFCTLAHLLFYAYFINVSHNIYIFAA